MKLPQFFFLFLIAAPILQAQSLLPPVDNYEPFLYKAASKNWGLAANEAGELFAANNSGLLHFNGELWRLYRLPNNTVIRSVCYADGKVYTGSYEEFGYWTPDEVGELVYTSLTHLIKNHVFTSEEFWEILPFGNRIVFRSFSALYFYSGNTIDVIDPPLVITDIIEYEGDLIAAGEASGLYRLREEALEPLPGQELLQGLSVSDMIIGSEGLLVGTNLEGCFLWEGNNLSPWAHAINDELKQQQLNKMLYLTNGDMVFGTIKNGIYLYDKSMGQVKSINKIAGLQNNTVLALLQNDNQLWVGEDNGIDRIQLNNPFTYFTDNTGTLGTLYDLGVYTDKVILGSNTGIYFLKNDSLQFVEGSQGHVWDLEVVEGDLLCGHNTGTFLLNNGQLEKVSSFSGGYGMVKIPETGSSYLQGTYNGLVKYGKDDTGKWEVQQVEGLGFPIRYHCFEDQYTLWVAHTYKGLYRVKLDSTYRKVVNIHQINDGELPNDYNIKLYKIKNQLVVLSDGSWYKYDPILGKIVLFDEFQVYNGMNLIHHEDGGYWFISNEESKEVVFTDLRGDNLILDEEILVQRLASEAENIIKQNDSIFYFTLTNGFARLNLSQFRKTMSSFELPEPNIQGFRDTGGRKPLNRDVVEIPYKDSRELHVEVSAASLLNPRYYYELEGPIRQANITDYGTLDFQNLPYGSYELKVSTIGADNNRSPHNSIEFRIRPPWYLSTVSIIVYALLLVTAIFIARWYNHQKLRKRQLNIKRQMHKEHQKRLAQMEKDKLAREIKRKQNELTGSTMQVAKKNELILELKGLLQMNREKFTNQQRYRAFMKKLNNSINDSQDWKKFEVNFNELHEDFFETLLQKYPRLTPKDLKLCAYLKMNLSTKEIAPLMGISVRGVEIHRYRLRKKLHLDGAQNISNFLITLK